MEISINGRTLQIPEGSNITVSNGTVFINGSPIDTPATAGGKVEINIMGGALKSVTAQRGDITVNGNVGGRVDCGGNVAVAGSVVGDIDCGGNVACHDVHGDIDCGGNVACGKISGSIDCGGSVTQVRNGP